MVYFASFMIAMLCTMAMIPPLIKLAPALKFVDIPDERKVHLNAIPRIGGVAMVIGALAPLFFWLPISQENISILSGMIVILVFGIWDDRSDLDYRIKFIGQALAALIAMHGGNIFIRTLPFIDAVLPFWLSWALTLLVFLAITNAMNLVDGLDGLAGGTTLLSLGTIALLAWHVEQKLIVVFAVAVMGAVLGFLRFNTHPARVFMGDSGSQFLGFTLAMLLLDLTQRTEVSLSLTLPFMLAGLPIIDTATVMIKRLREGRSPFSPDKNHLHHRLLKLGLHHYEVVIVIYFAQSIFVLSGYLMRFYSDFYILAFYLVYCLILLGSLAIVENYSAKFQSINLGISSVENRIGFVKIKKTLYLIAFWIIVVYLTLPIVMLRKVDLDFMVVGGVASVSSFLVIVMRRNKPIDFVERLLFYILISISTYYSQAIENQSIGFKYLEWGALTYLSILVLYAFLFNRNKAFSLTPLDVLLLILVVALVNLPENMLNGNAISYLAVKLVILFYSVELLFNQFLNQALICRVLLFLEFSSLFLRF